MTDVMVAYDDTEGMFVAYSDECAVYGTGNTPEAARQDYEVSLREELQRADDYRRRVRSPEDRPTWINDLIRMLDNESEDSTP